jgi:predicted PurR-regulated permease PerM
MPEVAAPDPAPPSVRRALNVNLTLRTLLLVSAVIALGWAFVSIRDAMLTVFLALFAALVLEPVVRLMQRHLSLGRGACATILVLGLLALAIVFTLLLLSPLAGSFRDFVDQLPSIVQDIQNNSSLGKWLNEHSSAPETAQANVKQIAQAIGDAAGGVLGVIVSGFSLVLSLVTAIFLTLFLMIDLQRLIGAVDTLLAPAQSASWNRVSERIITAVSRTMLGNIAISIICGTIYGVSCWLLGTPFPVVMGVIAGLLDLIPMVGATIAGTILVLATLTQGLTPALIMLAIVLVYQQFENYVLQPTILGKAANVSGFFVIFSVMIFGALLGVVGAIIAVPIIASIQIVVQELTAARRAEMAALRGDGGAVPPDAAAAAQAL